jgi:hypothetical protein
MCTLYQIGPCYYCDLIKMDEMDGICSAQGRVKKFVYFLHSCKYGNKLSGCKKGREFLDQLSGYQPVKKRVRFRTYDKVTIGNRVRSGILNSWYRLLLK